MQILTEGLLLFLGIVIEEEHLDSNHGNTNKKTTSIILTTKAQSAVKSNQYQHQGNVDRIYYKFIM